jgi:hypothetical protein
VSTVLDRIYRLEALVAAPPAGGPARRIAADYGAKSKGGKGGKGGGRRVASKAGEKRYGLPIGTPLGQTGSRRKADANTKRTYETFMSAKTPGELSKAAGWMSNDDLKRAGEALFSFQSKNERDEAARNALVREMAARGIDPHTVGYRGGPVTLNPNPKKDPHAVAADRRKATLERGQREKQREREKAQRDKERAKREADRAERERIRAEADEEDLRFRQQAGEALARGIRTDAELREAWRNRRRPQPVG